jgi:hypothetical protein
MMKSGTRALAIVLLMAGATSLFAEWWLETPGFYQSQGGASRLGPYDTREQAETVNNANFSGRGTVTGSNSPGGSGAAGGGAGSIATQAAGQIGSAVGNAIGKAMNDAMFGNPQAAQARRNEALALNNQGNQCYNQGQYENAAKCYQDAFVKSPNDPVIIQNLNNANQILTRQRQVADSLVRQANHDRLTAQFKPTPGADNAGGLTLKDLKTGDNGHVGVRGLPGIYLNNTPGKASDKPFGIPGLPGVYVNGPAAPSGMTQHDKTMPQQTADVDKKQIAAADKTFPDNKNANAPAPLAVSAKTPGLGLEIAHYEGEKPETTGTPQAPASLEQQAKSSQAAVSAATPEEAATRAGDGFDSRVPPANHQVLSSTGSNVPNIPPQQSGFPQTAVARKSSVQDQSAAFSDQELEKIVSDQLGEDLINKVPRTAGTPSAGQKRTAESTADLLKAFNDPKFDELENDLFEAEVMKDVSAKNKALQRLAEWNREVLDKLDKARQPQVTIIDRAKELEVAHDRIRKKEIDTFDAIFLRYAIHGEQEVQGEMIKTGLLKAGEGIDQKYMNNPAFHKMLKEARDRNYQRRVEDMSAADRAAQAELQKEFRRIIAK